MFWILAGNTMLGRVESSLDWRDVETGPLLLGGSSEVELPVFMLMADLVYWMRLIRDCEAMLSKLYRRY